VIWFETKVLAIED